MTRDIVFDVDISQPIVPIQLHEPLYYQNNNAHRVIINLTKNGVEYAPASGHTVTGYFVSEVEQKTYSLGGSISGSHLYVTLVQACYAVPTRGYILVNLGKTGTGASTTTVLYLAVNVLRSKTDTIVDPVGVIPDIDTLRAYVTTMQTATDEAETARDQANAAAARAETAADSLQDMVDTAVNNAGFPYTASGSSVTIHPVADSRIDFIAHIDPVQSGEGDPSPSNVRPITAPESVTIVRRTTGVPEYNDLGVSGVTEFLWDNKTGHLHFHFNGTISAQTDIARSTTNLSLTPGVPYIFDYDSFVPGANSMNNPHLYIQKRSGGSWPWERNVYKGDTFVLGENERAACVIQFVASTGTVDADYDVYGVRVYPATAPDPGYIPCDEQTVTVALPAGTSLATYDSKTGKIVRAVSAVIDGTTHKAASVNSTISSYGTVVYTNIYPYRDLSMRAIDVRSSVPEDLHCSHAITAANRYAANLETRDKVNVGYYSGSEVAGYCTLAFFFPSSYNITTVAEANSWFATNTPTVTYYPSGKDAREQTIETVTLRAPADGSICSVGTSNGTIQVSGAQSAEELGNDAGSFAPTKSGAMVNITDGADGVAIRQIDISLRPDTTGDASPDSPRGIVGFHAINLTRTGRNLWNAPQRRSDSTLRFNRLTNGTTVLNGSYTSAMTDSGSVNSHRWGGNNATGTYYLPAGTYTLRGSDTDTDDNFYYIARFIDENGAQIGASREARAGGPVTFTITEPMHAVLSVWAKQNVTHNNQVTYPQLEVGSVERAFEPYRGETMNIELPVGDLIPQDGAWAQGGINGSTGVDDGASAARVRSGYIPVMPGATYYVKQDDRTWCWLYQYGASKNFIGVHNNSILYADSTVYTCPPNVRYIRIVARDNGSPTRSITPSEIGTTRTCCLYKAAVYGGKVTIDKSGNATLTVTHRKLVYGRDYDWGGCWGARANGFILALNTSLFAASTSNDDVVDAVTSYGLTQMSYTALRSLTSVDNCICYRAVGSPGCMVVMNKYSQYYDSGSVGWNGSDTSKKEAFIIANGDFELVLKLKTPVTYQLTAGQFKTLHGENHIWADAGEVSVKYVADPAITIEELREGS